MEITPEILNAFKKAHSHNLNNVLGKNLVPILMTAGITVGSKGADNEVEAANIGKYVAAGGVLGGLGAGTVNVITSKSFLKQMPLRPLLETTAFGAGVGAAATGLGIGLGYGGKKTYNYVRSKLK